ncbi:MAG: hypothetical protein ACP5N2_02915 [Candidatus Nanoarchaeia archaeon]
MRGVISDSLPSDRRLINERKRMLMENIPIEHAQLSLDTYLTRLSVFEQNGILAILKGIRKVSVPYFRKESYWFGLLGVGTTTYSEEYWNELGEVLKLDDSKKKYIDNKGEDIDLLFCPEQCGGKLTDYRVEREYASRFGKTHLPTHRAIFYHRKRINKQIEEIGYRKLSEDDLFVWKNSYDFRTMITGACIEQKWKHTPWTDGAPFGVMYFEVPEQFVEQEKQSVVRVKSDNYGVENMTIEIPNCRTFHIYVNDSMCRAHRMEYERAINLPFVLIDGPGISIEDEINKKNGTYIQPQEHPLGFKQPNQIDELPF